MGCDLSKSNQAVEPKPATPLTQKRPREQREKLKKFQKMQQDIDQKPSVGIPLPLELLDEDRFQM
jgi:hypothetical protein